MAISPQQLTIYLYSAHRAVIFAIAQLSCNEVLSVVEQLATVLQCKSMTLSGIRESVSRVVASLTSVGCETQFTTVWNDVSRRDENYTAGNASTSQLPKRFDDGGPAHQYTDVMSYQRAKT